MVLVIVIAWVAVKFGIIPRVLYWKWDKFHKAKPSEITHYCIFCMGGETGMVLTWGLAWVYQWNNENNHFLSFSCC